MDCLNTGVEKVFNNERRYLGGAELCVSRVVREQKCLTPELMTRRLGVRSTGDIAKGLAEERSLQLS